MKFFDIVNIYVGNYTTFCSTRQTTCVKIGQKNSIVLVLRVKLVVEFCQNPKYSTPISKISLIFGLEILYFKTFPSLSHATTSISFKMRSWCETVVWFILRTLDKSVTHSGEMDRAESSCIREESENNAKNLAIFSVDRLSGR